MRTLLCGTPLVKLLHEEIVAFIQTPKRKEPSYPIKGSFGSLQADSGTPG